MCTVRTHLAKVALLVVVAGVLVGCPFSNKPDYTVAMLIAPESLDFGDTEVTLSFCVSNVWTSRPMPAFTVTVDSEWLSVTPTTGVSTGPDDPVEIEVTIDRSLMASGSNTGTVYVRAPGVTERFVSIRAVAMLVSDFTSYDQFPYVNEPVIFADQSDVVQGYGPITDWEWDFGDGNTSTDQNPVHTYTASGTYTVSLTVRTASLEATAVREDFITVQDKEPPVADFTASTVSPIPYRVAGKNEPQYEVQFYDLSTPGTAPITSWLWDFGDGGSSGARNPLVTYAIRSVSGVYRDVYLEVSTAHGADAELKASYIFLRPALPQASMAVSTDSPLLNQTVHFYDTSWAGSGAITNWLWDFGDGTTSTDQNPTHAFTDWGNFPVRLTVTTGVGSNTSSSKLINVQVIPPTANFSVSTTKPVINTSVSFYDQSNPGSASSILTWYWTFGDGGTSTLKDPTHTYTAIGSYTVSLTVTTEYDTDSVSYTGVVNVIGEIPVCDFEVDDQRPLAGIDALQFTDLSTAIPQDPITNWDWDFGDGSTSGVKNPIYTYPSPGIYDVGLTVTNYTGSASEYKADYIDAIDGTPLDEYVRIDDGAYDWSITNTQQLTGYTQTTIKMFSQSWNEYVVSPADHIWEHWLTIIDPDSKAFSDTAILVIDGGSYSSVAPAIDPLYATLAVTALGGSPLAIVDQVPNQPLVFNDSPEQRTEDELIAYTLDKYLDLYPDPEADYWPALLPMTKSAIKAMDTVQAYLPQVENFVVAGASKRGWTAWLTAAADPESRVIGVVPVVIDLLNMEQSMEHHYNCYNGYSTAVQDYVDFNVFPRMGTTAGRELQWIIDPYQYRTRLTMPKYGMNSSGDQFFVPDSAQFYIDDMLGDMYLRYLPNTDHSLGGYETALTSVVPFYRAVALGNDMPVFSWQAYGVTGGGTRLVVSTVNTPVSVQVWKADTLPGERDFRLATLGANSWTATALTATAPNEYQVTVFPPGSDKRTGFFVELTFADAFGVPYTFTTQVYVVPDTYPAP